MPRRHSKDTGIGEVYLGIGEMVATKKHCESESWNSQKPPTINISAKERRFSFLGTSSFKVFRFSTERSFTTATKMSLRNLSKADQIPIHKISSIMQIYSIHDFSLS